MRKFSDAIKVHLSPDLHHEVAVTAEEEGRSLSNVVRRVVSEWVDRRRADRDQQPAQAA